MITKLKEPLEKNTPWNKYRRHTYIRYCKRCDELYRPLSKGNRYCNFCLNEMFENKGLPYRMSNEDKGLSNLRGFLNYPLSPSSSWLFQ
jgi:hypothetical protein